MATAPSECQPHWILTKIEETDTSDAADNSLAKIDFDYEIKHSSWIALRILPSCHTNPIFVEVDGKPIHTSRKSADWCEKAVDVCWNAKQGRIRDSEKAAAKAAYDKAKEIYSAIAKESVGE